MLPPSPEWVPFCSLPLAGLLKRTCSHTCQLSPLLAGLSSGVMYHTPLPGGKEPLPCIHQTSRHTCHSPATLSGGQGHICLKPFPPSLELLDRKELTTRPFWALTCARLEDTQPVSSQPVEDMSSIPRTPSGPA